MDSELLKDRVFDTAELCERSSRPRFLGFLSAEQAVFAQKLLKHQNVSFGFFGGADDCQRVMLGCFPEWTQEPSFPITPITATFRKTDRLTHRDVLGTLMAQGLKREAVGDILLEEGRAVFFVTNETADYILSQVSKIGGVGVTLKVGFEGALPQGEHLEELTTTVSSERLDCVVSALIGVSRNKAVQFIEQSAVSVNSVVTEKITAKVNGGDIISVRTKGKFIVSSLLERTRKDRIVLKYKKYI